MAVLTLTNGAVVRVVQPTVATVRVVALPAGSAGGGSSDAYQFIQSTPAATWTIALPLSFPNRRPGVDIYVNDILVETDVQWLPSTKTVSITFPSPTSGVAVIT